MKIRKIATLIITTSLVLTGCSNSKSIGYSGTFVPEYNDKPIGCEEEPIPEDELDFPQDDWNTEVTTEGTESVTEENIPTSTQTTVVNFYDANEEYMSHMYFDNETFTACIKSEEEYEDVKKKFGNDPVLEAIEVDFDEYNLLFGKIADNLGSNKYDNTSLQITDNLGTMGIEKETADIGTSDMVTWYFMRKVEKKFYSEITKVALDIIEIPRVGGVIRLDEFYNKINNKEIAVTTGSGEVSIYDGVISDMEVNNEEDAKAYINYIAPLYTNTEEFIDIVGNEEINRNDLTSEKIYTYYPVINGLKMQGQIIRIFVDNNTHKVKTLMISDRTGPYHVAMEYANNFRITPEEAIKIVEKELGSDKGYTFEAEKEVYTSDISLYNLPLAYAVYASVDDSIRYVYHIGASNETTDEVGKILAIEDNTIQY